MSFFDNPWVFCLGCDFAFFNTIFWSFVVSINCWFWTSGVETKSSLLSIWFKLDVISLVFCSIALSAGSFCQYRLQFVRMCDSNSLDLFGCSGAGFDCEAGLHWFEKLLKSCAAASRSFEQLDWFACLSANAISNLFLLNLR